MASILSVSVLSFLKFAGPSSALKGFKPDLQRNTFRTMVIYVGLVLSVKTYCCFM